MRNHTARLWLGLFPALLGVAVVGGVLTATNSHDSNPVVMAVVLPLIGLSFVVSGLIAWTIRPDNGTGRLMVLVGVLWLVNAAWESDYRWLLAFAALFGALYFAAFLHLMVAFPEGRLDAVFERRMIPFLWLTAFLAGALPAVFRRQFEDCSGCPDNPVRVTDSPATANALGTIATVAGLLVFVGLLVHLVRRWRSATKAQRRVLGPVYLSGGVAVALVAILFAVGSFSSGSGWVLGIVAFTAFGLVPLFFLAGLLRSRLYRAASRLLREVPDEPTPEEAQEGLRTVLGDPTLQFLTWLDETGGYVDARGNPAVLQPDTSRRATTRIDDEQGRPLAALVHDGALLHQRGLLDEVVSAARLAIQKDRGLQALRRSESRSRALLDAIPDLMFRMARDGTYLEAKGLRESLVRPSEEIVGSNVRDLLPSDVASQFIQALAVPASKGVQTIEYRLTLSGEERDFEGRMVPSGDDEVVVIVRDFTERTRLEEELSRRLAVVQREQDFTREVVNVAPVLYILIDIDGRIIRFNEPTEVQFGVTDDDAFRGKYLWDVFLPEETHAAAKEQLERMNEGELQVEGQAEWVAQDGRRFMIGSAVRRVVDGEGNVRYLICGQDLTELTSQRHEIERQRDFLEVVARATPSLLIAVEEDGTVASEGVNYAFRELLGYTDEEAIGKRFWDLVAPPELIKEIKRAFEEQIATGISIDQETAWIGKSGTWRIVAWWLRPLGEQEGKYLVCGQDVTQAKAQEAELRASRSRIVEAGDDARMRLERNLHDGAQQRLVSLSLALRLAQAKLRDDPDGATELLTGASGELTHAIDELRELARGIHPAVLTDRGLAAALEALAARAPLPVELDTKLDERLPGPVEAAAYYVVAEALTNVAKYAEASAVEVRAQRQNGRVVVEVADDGIGGANPGVGSGLRGLADRVEALDGQLEVVSPPGVGTTVRAVIPLGSP